jgi:hypothetical protein
MADLAVLSKGEQTAAVQTGSADIFRIGHLRRFAQPILSFDYPTSSFTSSMESTQGERGKNRALIRRRFSADC